MDGKSILGVGIIAAVVFIFYGNRTETNTADRAVASAKIERSAAEHDARIAKEFGDTAAAEAFAARAAEANDALAKAKARQAVKEAAAEVRTEQIVEAAGAEISAATGKPFETGKGKTQEDLRKLLN